MDARKNRELMGTADIKKVIPKMAIPTIVAQLITTFYNLTDTFFVSKLGTNATAAVGVNSSLERTITLFSMLIGAGASSFIARLLGSRKDEEANQVMTTSLFTGIGIGLLIAVLGKVFLSPLVSFFGATPDCKPYSVEYGTYVLYAAPFIIGSLILNFVLRSEGSSTYAMAGMSLGGILNCFLDPLFIFALDLGVAGASIATAISKAVSFAILVYPYLRGRTTVSLSFRNFSFRLHHTKEVISAGMASFLRSLSNVIALILLNRVAGGYSTSALAAISVSTRIMMFPFAFILGFSQGFQPVAGYNWGAEKFGRVRDSLRFSLIACTVGSIILGALIIVSARPLISLFNSEADASIYEYGCIALRTEALFMFIHSPGTIINMFYAGIGKPALAAVMSTARQGYLFIPLLFILPGIWGIKGLCVTQGAADALSIVIVLPLFIKAMKTIKKAESQSSES